MHHSPNCPIYLAENGQWSSSAKQHCNCNVSQITQANTCWECPRCRRIHHIFKQTCDCTPPTQNSSTTTPWQFEQMRSIVSNDINLDQENRAKIIFALKENRSKSESGSGDKYWNSVID